MVCASDVYDTMSEKSTVACACGSAKSVRPACILATTRRGSMLYSSCVFSPRSTATESTSAATTAPSKTTPASAPACHVGTHVPLRGATVKTHADEKTLTALETMAAPESDVGSASLLLVATVHANVPVPLEDSCEGVAAPAKGA